MKRNMVWLVVALFFTLALRYAFGQVADENSGVGWDSISLGGHDPVLDIVAVMVGAPIVAIVLGILRLLTEGCERTRLMLIKLN